MIGRGQTRTNAENKTWSVRMADSTMQRFPTLAEEWNYPWGLVLKGIEQVWRATGDEKYFAYIKRNVDHFVQPDGAIRGYRLDEYNLDRLNTGKALFALYEKTREAKYKRALDLLRSQLDTHPRTQSGGFWHKQIYPYQVWLDGIYMADAFWAQYESVNASEAKPSPNPAVEIASSHKPLLALTPFDDIAHQIILIEQHTRDPKTGLLYHAWDESKQQHWANPETGCSPHFWGRAIGWYVMAIVDVLDSMPRDHARRAELIAILSRTITAVTHVQDANTGVWWQVLDKPFVIASGAKQSPISESEIASSHKPLLAMTQKSNYLESSASCMFVYAMVKGVRQKYLPKEFRSIAQRAFDGIVKQFIQVDDTGQVHLTDTCRSAGLGGVPYRDGSFEYYISEPRVTDNHHGVGAFILASTEIEQE